MATARIYIYIYIARIYIYIYIYTQNCWFFVVLDVVACCCWLCFCGIRCFLLYVASWVFVIALFLFDLLYFILVVDSAALLPQ